MPDRLDGAAALVQELTALGSEQVAARLGAILDAIPQAVVFVDDGCRQGMINHAAATLLDVDEGQLPTGTLLERVAAFTRSIVDGDRVLERIHELRMTPGARMADWIWHLDRPERRVLRVSMVSIDVAGVRGRLWAADDVTDHHAVLEALAESEERLRLALEVARMVAWEVDLRQVGAIGGTSDAEALTAVDLSFSGRTVRDFGSYGDFLAIVHPDDHERVRKAVEQAYREHRDFEDEFRIVLDDGESRWRYVKGRMFLGPDGSPARMVGLRIDITDRKMLEEELTRRAYHDPLTGLANRARFLDRVQGTLSDAAGRKRPAVLFLDLDGFKSVNDSLGHEAGDRLLVIVASRLLSATRGSDTVARFGGDEFAILLDGVGSEHEATIVAERVLGAVTASVALDGHAVRVGASIGIAIAQHDGDDAETLLRNADLAMYKAKNAGKERHAMHVTATPAAAP